MKVSMTVPSNEDFQALIEEAFGRFNRDCPRSKGRKYPDHLRDLVRQAIAAGARRRLVMAWSGMSDTAIKYAMARDNAQAAMVAPVKAARRLTVVGDVPAPQVSHPIAVIRLADGVAIELRDAAVLTPALLAALAGLEVGHATCR